MKDYTEIFKLIPQRLPMVMVDKHIYTDNNKTLTSFEITDNSMFSENGILTEAGILENMAQSAAARLGYSYITNKKEKPPIGIIASMQDVEIFEYPKTNTTIYTEINFVDVIMGVTLVECITKCNESVVAKGKMKILLRE